MYPCVGRLFSVLATDLIKRDNVDTSSLSLKLQLLAFFADVSLGTFQTLFEDRTIRLYTFIPAFRELRESLKKYS